MKTGNGIIPTGNGIISPTCSIPSKKILYKKFPTLTNESKFGFENKKWNYRNRKWNYFSYLQTSYQKTPFTKYFPFNLKSPKKYKKRK